MGPKPPVDAAADIANATTDGHLRLDRSVVPSQYTIELSFDPRLEKVCDRVTIGVDIATEAPLLRLHGQDMIFREVLVVVQDQKRAARVVSKSGGLALIAASPL